MKLFEFILHETSEEDRAIVSLSSALVAKLVSRYNSTKETHFKLGRIGDLVDTPLLALNDIQIEVTDADHLLDIIQKEKSPESTTNGVWDPEIDTIWINHELLSGLRIKIIRIISHELRHALDDMKSDYRAGESHRYDTPKKIEYRGVKNHPEMGNVDYLARPSEINARFLEVLTFLTRSISKNYPLYDNEKDLFDRSVEDLYNFMEKKKISGLFPEKEKSKEYRRLLRRGLDYIEKEIAYLASLN